MQAQAVLENVRAEKLNELRIGEELFRKRVGLFARVFGCWHKQLSRPFSSNRESYRVCLHCGAHRKFDTTTFKTVGPFYFNANGQK